MGKQVKSGVQISLATSSLFIGSFVSELFTFALGMYVLKFYKSSILFSLIIFIGPFLSFIFSPFIGHLVDHFDHKRIVIIAQISSTLVLSIATYFLFVVGNKTYFPAIIVVLAGLLELCDSFQSTAYKASTTGVVLPADQQKLIALEQGVNIIASLVSPILGGSLFAVIPVISFFILDIIGEIVALILILFLDFNFAGVVKVNEKPVEQSILLDSKEALSFIKSDKILTSMAIFGILANFSMAAINVGIPYVLVTLFNMKTTLFGIVQALSAVGMLTASILWSVKHVKTSLTRMTGIFGLLTTASFILFCLPLFTKLNIFFVYAISMLILGMSVTSINMPVSIYIRTKIPFEIQGRVNAFFNSAVSVLTPVGTAVFGILFNKVSPIILFGITGAILLILSIFMLSVGTEKKTTKTL
ncbi:MFS transporter [Companilactobacillus huachuanensis]|uniref:MFS transporter n=1 Tax=Companilactobacillus huachuanensis TaxID=2559914 RepID=A0ABW1RP82_9LACO|nr:MFS transporter [Companilactobacillus huachuanensis]